MEGTKNWIVILINFVLFIACMALVIVGQKTIEVKGLVMQLVGLAGILALIYVYNRKYQ